MIEKKMKINEFLQEIQFSTFDVLLFIFHMNIYGMKSSATE